MIAVLLPELVRLLVVLLMGSFLVFGLAWWFPVQRELDLSPYEYGAWDVQADIQASPADIPRIERDFGGPGQIFLTALWLSELRSEGGAETDVVAYVTLTPAASSIDYFPTAAMVDTCKGLSSGWIDVDIGTQAQLDLRPCDAVEFKAGGEWHSYSVRGVFAIAPVRGMPETSIVVDGSPLAARAGGGPGGYTLDMSIALVAGMEPDQVRAILERPAYVERFRSGGYDPSSIAIQGRAGILEQADELNAVSASLVKSVSFAASIALAALLLLEVLHFSSRARHKATILYRLGSSPTGLRLTYAVAASTICALALCVSGAAAHWLFQRGLITWGFPTTLSALYVGVTASLCGAVFCSVLALLSFGSLKGPIG